MFFLILYYITNIICFSVFTSYYCYLRVNVSYEDVRSTLFSCVHDIGEIFVDMIVDALEFTQTREYEYKKKYKNNYLQLATYYIALAN